MINSKKIKAVIGKDCDISLLKGVKYSDFINQVQIAKTVGKGFFKSKDKKLTKNCTICGHNKFKLAVKVYKVEYIQCLRCSHVSRKYYFPIKFLKKYWKKEGDVIATHTHGNQQAYRTKFLSAPKVNMVLKYLKKKKNAKWLDAGCGNGDLLANVKKNKIKPYGFDLNARDINLAKKKGINAYRTDIDGFYEIAIKNDFKFDVITANGYFDVINEPSLAMKMMNKMLRKNGLLMAAIPNFESVTHEMIKLYPENAIRHLTAAQRSSFTFKSLSYALKKNGFKPLFRWKYGLDVYMIMNYLCQKNPKFEKSKTMNVLTKRYNEFQKIFDEEDCSGSLFLICKKIRG